MRGYQQFPYQQRTLRVACIRGKPPQPPAGSFSLLGHTGSKHCAPWCPDTLPTLLSLTDLATE